MKTPYPVQWMFGIFSIFFSLFASKQKGKIVLTSFHGDGYRGNTKILFEHLINVDGVEPIWLSRNRKLVSQLKKKFGENRAECLHSFRGLKELSAAHVLLFTHGTSDFPFMRLPSHAHIIQTYHGLPTKRGEYLRPGTDAPPNFLHRLILNHRFKKIDCFLSSSPFVSEIFSKRFNIPKDNFLETGYPAYDSLFNAEPTTGFIKKYWPDAPEAEQIVLYSPTFRIFSKTRWFPFDDKDLDSFARYLEKKKILMLLRPHPNESFDFQSYGDRSPRFLNADQHVIEDIYSMLPNVDAVVTDYSSIFIEGLICNVRPIFIPYDIESNERGLPFNYNELTPGPKVSSQQELEEGLDMILKEHDAYSEEREKVKNKFFSHTDGKATERAISHLKEIIGQ